MKDKGRIRQVLEWALAMLISGGLFYAFYIYMGKPYKVKTDHHTSDLEEGDIIWLDRNSYDNLQDDSEFSELDAVSRKDLVYFEFSANGSKGLPLTGLARIVGLPGDTIKIYNGKTYINGREADFTEFEIRRYNLIISDFLNQQSFRKNFNIAEIFYWEVDTVESLTEIELSTTEENAIYIAGMLPVISMNQVIERGSNPLVFANGLEDQNADNYGPVVIPQKGDSIQNEKYWQELIANSPAIHRTEADTLVKIFREDFFFLLVDYRSKGNDSRFFGAIPQSKIKSVLD